MKKNLLDIIFRSDRRKNVLLLLQNGPQEMETFLKSLKTSRQALLPQMRILENHHLIFHYEDTYELTIIGKLLVDEMVPLLETIEVFDKDIDYWGNHNFDFIPPHLLKKISQIRNYEIINPSLTDMYTFHEKFNDNSIPKKSIYVVSAFLYPNHCQIISKIIEKKIDFFFIVSEDLLDKIRTHHYADFKKFIESEHFNFYVSTKKMEFSSFTFDDYHILTSLLTKKGQFDNKYILCTSKDSLQWGKELFEHCLKDSVLITDL
ncbi:MAG: winged helix-turn-helix domain-containing protein [Methanolobus sp.]|jgi:predicted transcriptional regulator|nr:winged helix-turn-helix domain-containing protein [Methanolobus sp.]